MNLQSATEEYLLALKQGQKEYKERIALDCDPYPAVLDEILPDFADMTVLEIGDLEIPAERIVGTKSAGRTSAFTASFRPLLGVDTEFAAKWIALCSDHLGDEGIRDPIICYEYLGNFYVQEGNKRVSVLRYFGAARIPGTVKRVLPRPSDDPRVVAYSEFLDFYKVSKLYTVQFRRPGDYAHLLRAMGRKKDEVWTEQDRRTFNSYFHYFQDAFEPLKDKMPDVLPEEALLMWLKLYPYEDLGKLTTPELKKTLSAISGDVVASSRPEQVLVQTKAEEPQKANLLTRIIAATPDHLNVAFIHQLDTSTSAWVLGHEEGRKHIEEVFGEQVTVRSYFDANSADAADRLIDKAVEDGAQVIFTTAPMLSRPSLKAAVKYPKVRFFNCSVDQPYSSIRTYYARIYEAKFITGAIAGAMAQDNRIGFIASYPIFGMTASINAFALGAQFTNPRAQIELRWSCCEGTPQADFFRDGIRVVSNRDVPTQDQMYLNFCNYGTYLLDDRGGLIPLGSPVWVWGKFYENALRSILSGPQKEDKDPSSAVNYWLGMDSGVISVNLSSKLPEGVKTMAKLLRSAISNGTFDPFARKITAQDGSVKNDGTQTLTPAELLHMDWLCDNVVGEIPTFDQILPRSRAMVRELGLYRDKLTDVEEGVREDFDHLR